MMPAWRFYRFDFSAVDPLLERGVTDSQDSRRFAWRQ
jgi:hypothetical protein